MAKQFEKFGKYILLEKLATGGMAEVFLALAPGAEGVGKFVAIKRILPQYSDNQEFIDMFKDEAKIAINLTHSNIVSIHEFGLENHQFFLVMDYVEGRNLRQILNKLKASQMKLTSDHIIYLIKESAAGLDHAHRCLDGSTGKPLNITHRDMSPQNVMISFDGAVKIVDFGIAKAESQLENTRVGTLKGKFGYMSPEQAEGQQVDLRTDIFSLGTVLWELLADDRLFMANNELNTLRKIRDCQIPSLTKINPNIHPELERITMKALARDRNLRYQTAAAFHRDLNRFLNRQYPDFSAQDFSVFVKTIYATEILENRKRLILYAQSNGKTVDGGTPPDVVEITQSKSGAEGVYGPIRPQTFSEANIRFNEPNTNSKSVDPTQDSTKAADELSHPNFPNAQEPQISHGVLDEKAILSEMQRDLDVMPKNDYVLETPIQQAPRLEQSGDYIEDSQTTRGQRYPRTRVQKRSSQPSALSSLLMIFVALLGSYLFLSYSFPEEMKPLNTALNKMIQQSLLGKVDPDPPLIPEAPPPLTPVPPGGGCTVTNGQTVCTSTDLEPTPPPAAPKVALIINTSPSGAEIYINGESTGQTTPTRLEVPSQPFDLTLKKASYIDYVMLGYAANRAEGKVVNATLQKAPTGYIDIDVLPPPHLIKIYVNGIALKEKLPINRYAVPAGTQVTVKVVNPISGQSDERTLFVQKGQRQSVVLTLKENYSTKRKASQER